MGAGCSSPLKRLGGKRGKNRRESSPVFEKKGTSGDKFGTANQDLNIDCEDSSGATRTGQQLEVSGKQPLKLENEITVHSEVNEDHPSTASYYTDIKCHNEETKFNEHSGGLDPKSNANRTDGTTNTAASLAARMMGLNGSYAPHDRHLLVSPALSPAPSTCYSPTPASSTPGSIPLDLNDINEAFRILTFGLPADMLPTNSKRIILTERNQQQLELYTHYTHQLVQSKQDLINSISVVFLTSDTYQFIPSNQEDSGKQLQKFNLESLTNHVESCLKSYCDEHLYNFRFLNLSHEHLSEHFHINNLPDASMKLLENEFNENGQRLIVIILSNTNLDASSGDTNTSKTSKPNQSPNTTDKRQLPTKIEAQTMTKLLNFSNMNGTAKELLKQWYNQIGNIYYLNPIYLVYPKISSSSKEERDLAWQNWLNESSILVNNIKLAQDNDPEISFEVKLKSLFNSQLEFIIQNSSLQKRTLLIRESQPSNSVSTQSNHQQPQLQQPMQTQSKDLAINELSRKLADPHKLTLKRSICDEESVKTASDWIIDNFNKFFENIQENQIVNGKHIPPFIDRNLFIELTCQRHNLEHYLDNVSENFELKSHSFYNNQISPLLSCVFNPCTTSSIYSTSDTSSMNNNEQQPSANHLVFISGPKGCGKSTLFSQIVKLAVQDSQNKAQVIYRFCKISSDSSSPNRLLRSVCEQFCQTQGENITAASYIYSVRKEVMSALNKTIKSLSSLIFLDGLDEFKQVNDSSLDWLCEIDSSSKIKIFITLETDSELYKKVLGSYSDATFISLDNPSFGEWAQMLTSTARSRRFSSSGNLYDEIHKLKSTEPEDSILSYSDIGDILHMCRIRQLNNESIYPELSAKLIHNNSIRSFKNVQQVILSHLQYLLSPYQLIAFLIVLTSSRNGLSESDLANVMTIISQSSKLLSSADTRFSLALLDYVKLQLQPWIKFIINDKFVKTTVSETFATEAIGHLISIFNANLISEIREILLDYFSRQTKSKSSKGGGKLEANLNDVKENLNSTERIALAIQFSEVIHLLLLTNPIKAKEYIMNKNNFFLQFFYGSMPEEFIEDYQRLKDITSRKSSGSEELQSLVTYVRQSIYPLRYDGFQIFSQIYCRAYETIKAKNFSKSKKFNDILNLASCPPLRNLLPASEASVNSFIKTRIGQNQTQSSNLPSGISNPNPPIANSQKINKPVINSTSSHQQTTHAQQSRQKIYTIRGNHRHVIVIYPDRGSLSVWDIFEEKAVRTIANIDQPRDLKMIDQKRAVILCNRELRVYDLDSGDLLTKLKGVMNQKMPFFEIFDEKYVVALARNRMYVNMLNLETGELETTFKVGEDRFLNSLLVSANGGICVCGDETQKPFPLLVWNLNERRLLYDLRLDRHEFITRMSAISDDGHFVVSVCRQLVESEDSSRGLSSGSSIDGNQKSSPNFIVIYDLSSGTLFKKWKPGLDSYAVAISVSNRSGKVINSISDSSILIWDLATGSKRHTLYGHSAPPDVIRVQNNRLFSMDSTCRDQSLRIWDIEEGYCLSVFSSEAPVNCCQMSIHGDTLVCGFAAETRLSTLVMCKNETVNDVVKRNKRRKSSKSIYIFDEPPPRKQSQ